MNFLILLFLTILPSYIIGRYIYKKDTEKKPKKLIAKIIGATIVFTIIAAILESLFKTVWSTSQTFIQYLIEYMIGVALIEEICKFLPAYFIGIKNKTINHKYDIIVYTVFSAIGFATFENILYVFTSSGINTALYRMIFAIPAHAVYGMLMGYFLGNAYQEKQNGNQKAYRTNKIYSLLIPTIFHGIYDFGIIYGVTSSNALILISPYITIAILLFYTIRKVKKVASNETEKENNEKGNHKLLVVALILIVILLILSNLNPIRLNNGHYNMKENVRVKEDEISVMVESFEEDQRTGQITLDLKIKNLSNENITLGTNQFSLVNMKNTKDVRSLSKFEANALKSLSMKPKETVTTKIKFGNVVTTGGSNYLLGYEAKRDNTKTYIIFIGTDFAQALQDSK